MADQDYFVHESRMSTRVRRSAPGPRFWHFSTILPRTQIGKNCSIAQNVMIGRTSRLAIMCMIQNNVSLYKGVELADAVFCGPSCVFTNVLKPRADVERKD